MGKRPRSDCRGLSARVGGLDERAECSEGERRCVPVIWV
jgi:hypothetical protein